MKEVVLFIVGGDLFYLKKPNLGEKLCPYRDLRRTKSLQECYMFCFLAD